ncbi:MAG TPA: hypothetical protein VMN81_06030 [Vicinamibacterales bacterium]|nr:hypothetical protein [Vicinamibacterales bacterium]
MDTAALVASLTSVLAIGLTIVLMRLVRQDRQRSEARVAALVSLAGMPAAAPPPMAFDHAPVKLERRPAARPAPAPVPVPRPRPAAPVRLSAADVEIFRDTAAAPVCESFAPAPAPGLFEPAAPNTRSHLLYIGIGAVVMVLLFTLAFRWAVSRAGAPTTETVASIAAPAAAPVAQPLGLVSLRHEQAADGSLVISGVVRNPPDSIGREKLFAAAALIDAGGALVATARAPLDFTTLAPGDESPFVVRIAAANGVARYRIGFRDAAGAPVAHIDRR